MTSFVRRGFVDSIAKAVTVGYNTAPLTFLELTPDTTGGVLQGVSPTILFSSPIGLQPVTSSLVINSPNPAITFIGDIVLTPTVSNNTSQSIQPLVALTVAVDLYPLVTKVNIDSPRPLIRLGKALISDHTIEYSPPVIGVKYAPEQVTLIYNVE